jgi:hypothetical protein
MLALRALVLSAVVMGLLFGGGGPPSAAHAAPKGERFYFLLTAVDLKEGIPQSIAERVRARLLEEFSANAAILTEYPPGAPDPETSPKQFKKFLTKHKIRAFKVRVEVLEYERSTEQLTGRAGQYLRVGIKLHMFGETIPDRVMAFTGSGAATIKVEVGKKVRPREEEVAHQEAVTPAVNEAVEQSLHKLRMPPPMANKKRSKR